MTQNVTKIQELVSLLAVSPMTEKERNGWMMLAPHMEDAQIDKLIPILKSDAKELADAVLEATKAMKVSK